MAVKAVSLAEEYLCDHFPTFPVLPGVLMLEALVEAAAWLVRDAQDFSESVILLRRAKNVTYKSFVKPGNLLTLSVTCTRMTREESEFQGVGHSCDQEVVRARLGLTHFSLAGRGGATPDVEALDRHLTDSARARFALLFPCGR